MVLKCQPVEQWRCRCYCQRWCFLPQAGSKEGEMHMAHSSGHTPRPHMCKLNAHAWGEHNVQVGLKGRIK